MTRHSVSNNTRMGVVISLFKFKSFDQFNPPKLPKILDIYSVVVLYIVEFNDSIVMFTIKTVIFS